MRGIEAAKQRKKLPVSIFVQRTPAALLLLLILPS
jgi:hypothetical protein